MLGLINDWTEEKRSAYLYQIMATYEVNPARKRLFLNLAKSADKQASLWQQKIAESGEAAPKEYRPDSRTRIVSWLIKQFGTQRMRYILSAMKVRGMSIYSMPQLDSRLPSAIAEIEQRHKGITTAGNLRAAVFGVNDGLLSNASLILGVAGANVDQQFILISGIAGLLAGACSMAAGEYVSVRSQRELFEYQIELERAELKLYPQEEAAELALIYQARGLPEADAKKLADSAISNPEQALDTLAREELGLNPNDLGSPIGAATSSFFSFCMGALVPLLPFLLSNYHWNLIISIGLTVISLFSIGATLSLFTNRSALKSGTRMLAIGVLAGCLTYLVGKAFSVTIL